LRAHAVRTRGLVFFLLILAVPLLIVPVAALSQEVAPAADPAARNRQEEFPRRVAVYVVGGVSDSERTAFGAS
jgi:hypothetical protein